MIVIESSDFSTKTLIKKGLLSFNDLNNAQKEAYNLFVKEINNNEEIIGRNKPSFKNKNHYVQDFIDKNLWHYHSGLVTIPISSKPYNYINKKGDTKYWISKNKTYYSKSSIKVENKDGLVCDFLIHYTIIKEFLFIYCASSHGEWEVLSEET